MEVYPLGHLLLIKLLNYIVWGNQTFMLKVSSLWGLPIKCTDPSNSKNSKIASSAPLSTHHPNLNVHSMSAKYAVQKNKDPSIYAIGVSAYIILTKKCLSSRNTKKRQEMWWKIKGLNIWNFWGKMRRWSLKARSNNVSI